MARNCSGRLEGGGGSKRFSSVGSAGAAVVVGGAVVAGSRAKGVRWSEGGMRGKEVVEKR